MKKIALIGTYSPRKCGIASFNADLYNSISNGSGQCDVLAINDGAHYNYPCEVKFQIQQHTREDYLKASKFLNDGGYEVVCIQHEFGIFGGENGSYVLDLVKRLKMPVVLIFHTILDEPSEQQKEIVCRLNRYSSRIVVMLEKGKQILIENFGISEEKIKVIGHGIPDYSQFNFVNYKEKLGVENKKVLLTFGLLSKNKGIETTIKALPKILKKHPDIVYVILGASHPHVVMQEGENYRFSLMELARSLNVDSHVIFINQFVSQEELFGFLEMSDIYIIPYLSEKQITSGTLAYAMATHNAVVSTPFWHAQEALANGKGLFFNFHDAKALGKIVNRLLDQPSLLNEYQNRALNYAHHFDWKKIGEKYIALFQTLFQPKLIQFYNPRDNAKIARNQTRSFI